LIARFIEPPTARARKRAFDDTSEPDLTNSNNRTTPDFALAD
jgi:hypothetical protein